MNTEATPELIQELNPDTVICAVGAEPIVPEIPGIDQENVIKVTELGSPRPLSGKG